MKILITGGAGFIGSHISRLLIGQGHTVLIYDNLSKSTTAAIHPKALFIQGDLLDQNLLSKTLANGIQAVIHMASFLEIAESIKEPIRFAQNNILGSIYLLEAMRQTRVKKIIFSSSATVYGFPKSLPIKEDAPLFAANPYGASKIATESFLQSYHYLYGFDVITLRYFNPYGPFENHQPETHAVPNFIKAGLTDTPLPLYWKGEQIRDYIYVEDLAQAHIDILNLTGYHIFNVGSEKGVKVMEVVDLISKIMAKKLKINDLGERPGDVPATYASSQLLQKLTGWKAKFSLEKGLEKTVEWFKDNLSQF